ncbi:hypothetical protein REJ26_001177 [Providencia stuartii]|uniref:hypothetical protein n=1 Tax=Providencia TaxID=586 RepID=UPI0027FAEB39|nr:hypothetical protein [Providencia sp. 2023EL-00965]ELR5299436.1 hypothetical protein [Providencia stuartii]MDW7588510.1 hypothetical protein [Providencia sp. 2023EL-00965]
MQSNLMPDSFNDLKPIEMYTISEIKQFISVMDNRMNQQLEKVINTREFQYVSSISTVPLVFSSEYIFRMKNFIKNAKNNMKLNDRRIELLNIKEKILANVDDYSTEQFNIEMSKIDDEMELLMQGFDLKLNMGNGDTPKILDEPEVVGFMGEFNLSTKTNRLVINLRQVSKIIDGYIKTIGNKLDVEIAKINEKRTTESICLGDNSLPISISCLENTQDSQERLNESSNANCEKLCCATNAFTSHHDGILFSYKARVSDNLSVGVAVFTEAN